MVYRFPGWSITAFALSGCGGNSLHEDSTGFVDLVPFFHGGATTADPTAGLPRVLAPTRGWISGQRVEYYDFGAVTVPRKTGVRGEALRVPDAAPVADIYFFYDSQGRPLFAKPAFDPRSNTWFMPGGTRTMDPAPIDSADFSVPYVARPRAPLMDDARRSSGYQRPIIDVLADDGDYNGLWQVVEVTVKDSDYEVDDVKSARRVEEGIEEGKLSARDTGLVINCPVVDERTQVLPSAMHNNIPRPRLEIWYRTKLGNCFLANGWESIGETLHEDLPATDRSNLRLFNAGEMPASRGSTIEVISENVGDEVGARITVPVSKLFVPAIAVALGTPNLDRPRTRFPGDDLGMAMPRQSASDPGGYSPIVWMWDINVPQQPIYVAGSNRDAATLGVVPDASPPVNPVLGGAVEARDGGTTVVTRNIAVIGAATNCVADADCKFGQQCNPMPDAAIATTDPPAGLNIVDVVIQREGHARCDVPATGFGGYCAPGVSRCDVQAVAGGENETRLKALGVASAGPTFTVHADLATAEQKLKDTTSLSMGVDLSDRARVVTPDEMAMAMGQLAGLEAAAVKARERAAYYDGFGFTKDLNGWGYSCYPGGVGVGTGPGFCAIRCDSTASATVVEVKTQITPPGEEPSDYTFRTEPRCGGVNMLGYRCLPTGTLPQRQRVCLRECNRQANTSAATYVEDPAPTLAFNRALCDHPLNLREDATTGQSSTAFSLSGDLPAMTEIIGQGCNATSLSVSGAASTTVRSCGWNVDFVPRDPNIWPIR